MILPSTSPVAQHFIVARPCVHDVLDAMRVLSATGFVRSLDYPIIADRISPLPIVNMIPQADPPHLLAGVADLAM